MLKSQRLLVILMILLNVGGIISVILSFGKGNARWITDLVTLIALNAVGFYLLRIAGDDA